jgi:hypothetical protein
MIKVRQIYYRVFVRNYDIRSKCTYKNDFRDVLTSLKKKKVGYDDVVGEITFLLSIIGLDMDISQNYIGISDKNRQD